MRILNGRTFGDSRGKFTAHCSLGSSVIDYMIISEEMSHKVLSFHVHDFKKSLSNHCMLSCMLSANFIEQTDIENPSVQFPIPVKYKWDSKSITKF